MRSAKNPSGQIEWGYCECGCHGNELQLGPAYYWMFNDLVGGFTVRTGHSHSGELLGKFKSFTKADVAVRKHAEVILVNKRKELEAAESGLWGGVVSSGKTKARKCTKESPLPPGPFHESVVDLIKLACPVELSFLARLIKATDIPDNHDAIRAAWQERTRERSVEDFEVSADLNRKKSLAGERKRLLGDFWDSEGG